MSVLGYGLVTTMDDDQQLWLFDEIGATKDFRITKANLLKEDRARLTQNESDINDNTNNISTLDGESVKKTGDQTIAGDFTIENTAPKVILNETDEGQQYSLRTSGGDLLFVDDTDADSVIGTLNGKGLKINTITSALSIITTGTYNALDVTNIGVIRVDTSGGDITINGLTGGVAGQQLHIIKTSAANNLNLNHASGGASDQIILLPTGANEVDSAYICRTLVCSGGSWNVSR